MAKNAPQQTPAKQHDDPTALRRWAIEHAIKLHGANGVTTNSVITEADKLLEYVNQKDEAGHSDRS